MLLTNLFLGKSVRDKLADVRDAIRKLNAGSIIVTALEDIACKCLSKTISKQLFHSQETNKV